MMIEVMNIHQKDKGRSRRWFEDDFFELIVWYDGRMKISGFQLCYDRYAEEHVLTWRDGRGFNHDRIDDSITFSNN